MTLDPLHNKFEPLDTLVKKGGDYIVGTKDNTSKRLEVAQSALQGSPLLAAPPSKDMGGSNNGTTPRQPSPPQA